MCNRLQAATTARAEPLAPGGDIQCRADIETLRLAALTKLRDERVAAMLAAAVEHPPPPPMARPSRW